MHYFGDMFLWLFFGFILHAQQASVVIDAPIREVWEYNSQNENAEEWSVYFAKIVGCPLADCPSNTHREPTDIGYIRRCFRQDDEVGIFWDEETLFVKQEGNIIHKGIRAFNYHGFFSYNDAEQLVEQFYEEIDDNTTRLTFRSRLYEYHELTKKVPVFLYNYWMLAGLFNKNDIQDIFEKNLVNIKAAIEMGPDYRRIYPYEP